mgnify:CR=1 FL=1
MSYPSSPDIDGGVDNAVLTAEKLIIDLLDAALSQGRGLRIALIIEDLQLLPGYISNITDYMGERAGNGIGTNRLIIPAYTGKILNMFRLISRSWTPEATSTG